jgi:hypothetical protein
MFDREDLSYIAGYIDGEGCFWIGQHHKIGLSVSNTHKPTIEWLQRKFGGSISNPRKRKQHHRPVYTWQIVSQEALKVLQAVVPFLREKTEQALLLIALQQTKGLPLRGRKLDPEVFAERERLSELFKGTRHVAW